MKEFCFMLFLVRAFAGEFLIISSQIFPNHGMFASANQILGQLYLFETQTAPAIVGLSVDFGEFGLYFDPEKGPNWWNYYFEPLCCGAQGSSSVAYATRQQCSEAFRRRREIGRSQAAAIVEKYIRVKPHIQEKVDRFVAEEFQDYFVLGVHYRGTDKEREAPRVAYDSVIREILRLLPMDQPYRIFVATDEALFLRVMKERFADRVLAIEMVRSAGGETGIHFANSHRYEMGESALIDSLLLSRCSILVRTSSYLSLWSTYFNPELPVVLLSTRHRVDLCLEPE